LDTNDTQDRPITGKNRIVFAWGLTDVVSYHGSNRHFTAVQFFGTTPNSTVLGNPSYSYKDFLNPNYTIPATDTTYYYLSFLNLDLPQDVHVVRLEAIIDPTSAAYVHHFLMYGCHNSTCGDAMWAWAPGVDSMELPSICGFRLGPSAAAWNGIQLQIHYNNPAPSVSGVIDQSGVRVYYTPNLRQHDADILELGDALVTNPNIIPQGSGLSYYEYNCPSECTSMAVPLNVFGSFLHMHYQGSMIWTTQWRNGSLLGYQNRIEFWDFAFQQTTPMNSQILPGDRLNTHCIYNQNPLAPTKFSIASSDEMCLEYVYYWPKLPGPFCSFIYQAPRNYTACGEGALMINQGYAFNPTVLDPAGGEIKTFGATNPSSFVCPSLSTPSQGTSAPLQGTSAPVVDAASNLPFFASVLFALTAIFL